MAERRVFSEKEVSEILLRAAKLQEQAPVEQATYAPGFTKDELLRVAAELGLSTEYLERAIRESDASVTETEGKVVLGVPFGTEIEHIIEGEVPVDRYDIIADAIGKMDAQAMLGVRQLGKTLTGPYKEGLNHATFTITPRDGRTRLRFRYSPFIAYFVTMHWMGLVSLVLFPILMGSGVLNVGQGLAGMLLGLAGGWAAWGAVARMGLDKMRRKADEVAAKLQDEVDALRTNLSRPVAQSATDSDVHLDQST